MPLMGYPGTRLTNTSIKLNEFNWGVHAWTLQTLYRRFKPDGVFLLMDLAVEASGMGLQVRFPLMDSPSVEIHPVEEESDLDQFHSVDVLKDGRTYSFIETMHLVQQMLPPNEIGGAYVAGPFTLAGLLCGANDIGMNVMLKRDLVLKVLQMATSVITRYALALEDAGADMVMILDPLSVMLGPDQFQEFAGRFTSIVISALKDAMPVYHVCGDTTHLLDQFGKLGAHGLSLDADVDLAEAAQQVPADCVLIGNIDPVSLLRKGNPEQVRQAVLNLRKKMDPYPNFILSTGCDLPQDTPFENIDAMIQAGMEDL
ncbi:MAG: uroporphyrinogen decarboxylase family protein [Planctomycetota bacterium]